MRASVLAVLLFIGPATAQQTPAPANTNPVQPESQLAALEGKVIDASTGQPVRKANLTLMKMQSTGMTAAGPPQSHAVATDPEGRFSFAGVEPGRYMLSAEKTGYVRQQYGSRSGQFGSGTNLTLDAGRKISNLEFKLMPQAVISGKVLDEDGEPLSNAMVSVLRQMPLSRQPSATMGGSTNDIGEFRIANLTPGRYLLRAEYRGNMFGASPAPAPGKAEGAMGYVATYYPGVTDPAAASPVAVAAGQQASGMNIQLRKTRVFQVSGRIEGAPSGRIQISLQPQRPGGGMFGFGGGGGTAKPDGAFVIPAVQPGSWTAVAMSFDAGRAQILGRAPVNVANANVENLVIHAGMPLELTGRVIREGDPPGSISGQVMLQPAERGQFPVAPATIQNDGTFRIAGVSRDKYFVLMMGSSAELYVKTVKLGETDVTEGALDLSDAETAAPLEIVLSTRGATVQGVVLDGEKPSPGAVVALLPQPFQPDRPPARRKTTTTDQNGRFSIQGVAPGEYRVYACDTYVPWNDVDPEQLKPLDKLAVTVKLKEEAREEVTLKISLLGSE